MMIVVKKIWRSVNESFDNWYNVTKIPKSDHWEDDGIERMARKLLNKDQEIIKMCSIEKKNDVPVHVSENPHL